MKNYMMVAVSFALGALAYGQTLEDAIKKTDNERYDLAEKDFQALIAKEPARGDIYFYYGENFFAHDEAEEANKTWQKGLSVDPGNALNNVGLGKYLWYKGDTTAARQQFNTALTSTKRKNADVLREIATVFTYAPLKNLNEAVTLLNAAIKIDSKNVEAYLVLGDALLEITPANGSPAIKNYNTALDLNPKSSKGLLRKAKLYQRSQNYEEANNIYKEAQVLDPTFAPAYRENAELNMMFNQWNKAIENWKKYLELNPTDEARYRFASALVGGKKYCEAIPELQKLEANGYSNFYTARMMTYSLYECNEANDKTLNEKGLAASEKFFSIVPKDKLLASDYRYKGLHYSKLGQDSLAIIELEKATTLDPEVGRELKGDIGKLYMKMKKYDKAVEAYTAKMAGNPENLNATEYFELGRAYYFGPQNFVLADSAFAKLNEKAPEFSVGYLWRARSNFKLETPTAKWLAKPYYEQYLTLVKPEERTTPAHKPLVIEASKYLGDYYINSPEKDNAKAKEYWRAVQELDPADKQAKAFFASPAGK